MNVINNSFFKPFLIFGIFALVIRWILILGIGDFADDYELLLFYLNQKKLFVQVFPAYGAQFYIYPTYYLAKIITFSPLLSINISIWLYWLISIFLVYKICLQIKLNEQTILSSILLLILVFNPVNSNFVIKNYYTVSLGLLSLYLILINKNILKSIILYSCLFLIFIERPNLGLAFFLIIFIDLFLNNKNLLISKKKEIYIFLLSMIVLLFLFNQITGDEITIYDKFRIIIFGAASIKGNFIELILRSMPRISFKFDQNKYLYEALIIFPIYLFFFILFFKKDFFLKKKNPKYLYNFEIFLIIFFIITIFISLIQLDISFFSNPIVIFLKLISFPEFMGNLLYSITFLIFLFYLILKSKKIILLKIQRKKFQLSQNFLNYFYMMLIIGSFGVGGRYTYIYIFPFLIPFLSKFFLKYKFVSISIYFLIFINFIFYTFAPNWNSNFSTLSYNKLIPGTFLISSGSAPNHKPLYVGDNIFNEINENFGDKIDGKTVDWFFPFFRGLFNDQIPDINLYPFGPGQPILNQNRKVDNLVSNYPDFIITLGKYNESFYDSHRVNADDALNYNFFKVYLDNHYKVDGIINLVSYENNLTLWKKLLK